MRNRGASIAGTVSRSCEVYEPPVAGHDDDMVWTADRCYVEGLAFFGERVHEVRDWEAASPCAGWRAVDVLGHVGAATSFGTAMLRGEAPQWSPPSATPGDAVSGDPVAWWDSLAGPAREALVGVDLAQELDSPIGRRTIGEGLSFPAIDLFVHGWDLARSSGTTVEIPRDAIAFAHSVLDPVPPGTIRSPRVFGPEAVAPVDATASERFLAWTGRAPR